MMLISLVLLVIGTLYIILPHFLLPLGLFKGGTGALLLTECSVWYHPEIYLGVAIGIVGLLYLKKRGIILLLIPLSLLTVIQALALRPVSFYLGTEEPIVILAQTNSIRAHTHLRESLLILALLVLFVFLAHYLFRRRQARRITLPLLIKANLGMRRFRTTTVVLSLVIVLGALFMDMLLTESVENALEIGAGRLGADLMVVPKGRQVEAKTVLLSGGPTTFYLKKGIFDGLSRFPEVDRITSQLFVQPFSYLVCCIVENVLIIAYDPETDFTVAPWINYKLKRRQGPYDLVVGRGVKFYPGQKIDLFGRSFNVVASLDPTGVGYFDNSIFVPYTGIRIALRDVKSRVEAGEVEKRKQIRDDSFTHLFGPENIPSPEEIDPEGISAIFIKTKDGVDVDAFVRRIKDAFPEVDVVKVKESTITVKRHLISMIKSLFLPILLLLGMGTLILAVVFSMSVTERLREIGLLRAVGARRVHVFRMVLGEAIVLTTIGGIIGILWGTVLLLVFKNRIMSALNLLYIWPPPSVVMVVALSTVLISLLVGLVSGFYPALRASRMEPYLAIRQGER